MFFKSTGHREGFLTAIQGVKKVYDGKIDQEYGAALYILTADESTWNKASDYVERDRIDFEKLIEEVDFSHGYSVLIKWASNLFNSGLHIDPVELMRLDDDNFMVALTALQIRRRSLPMEVFTV